MAYSIDEIKFRDFDRLVPTDYMIELECEYAEPRWVDNWVCRVVYEDGDYKPESPIVEFYSADTNQFVSAYFVETFMGEDQWGGGWGCGLDLQGDVPAWKMSAADADAVRVWLDDIRDDIF